MELLLYTTFGKSCIVEVYREGLVFHVFRLRSYRMIYDIECKALGFVDLPEAIRAANEMSDAK